MNKLVVLFFLTSISATQLAMGQGKVSVSIIDKDKKAVENSTVELMRSNDLVVVKTALTDKSGTAEFENVKNGNYIVKSNLISHHPAYSSAFTIEAGQDIKLPALTMIRKDVAELSAVKVFTKKPFIQRLNDRLVVNVENSIVNAGSTALEVLEKSPGVTISSNDVISMRGKAGVIVMIDGKQTAMSGEELANYLRSLPSTVIQQIDLITNPSAKYDAAGNAGIIDIKLKRSQKLGTNGTFTTGLGQGIFPKANTGLTFNSRGEKTNLYGNTNFNYLVAKNELVLQREFYKQGIYDGAYIQDNLVRRWYKLPSARLGFDYYLNKKTVIGVVGSTNMAFTKRTTNNTSNVLDNLHEYISNFTTTASGHEYSKNYLFNVNYKHSFDSTGTELTIDADYSRFIQDWGSDFISNYYDKFGVPLQAPYKLTHDQDGKLQIRSAKADYIHPFAKTFLLETGFKTSFVSANTRVIFYNKSNGNPVIDSSKSNHFLYDENINAAYVSIKKKYKKVELQFGLRAENTHLKTRQLFFNTGFDTSYLQFFPSTHFTYTFNDKHALSAAISRRIDRPTYGQLNPFRIFLDPSYYASGDPNIQPQITWSYELGYSYKNLNFQLSYSHSQNVITYAIIPIQNRVTLQTAVNFQSSDYTGLTISAPVKITKWWNSINNVNLVYNTLNGFIAQTNINSSYFNAILSSNNSFTLPNGWAAELNLNFSNGSNNGVLNDRAIYGIAAGIQKTVLKNKGTLRFAVTDILYKTWPRLYSRFAGYREDMNVYRDTRVATMTFTYRFGNNKVQAARRRTTASDEERRRAGN